MSGRSRREGAAAAAMLGRREGAAAMLERSRREGVAAAAMLGRANPG